MTEYRYNSKLLAKNHTPDNAVSSARYSATFQNSSLMVIIVKG